MDAYAAAATADPDPWHGFTGYVHALCAMQAADRGFADVLTMTFPAAKALEERRAGAYHGFLELIASAQATGHLRDDGSMATPTDRHPSAGGWTMRSWRGRQSRLAIWSLT
ncbi:hypothetical protein [Nonomuraea sp. NPDC049480]|uniref:hypothetical protein n=1 Tax=Nonomuraea sp. NPDC049480 TaxID=3364353 RepID=UPI00378A0CA1